MAFTMVSHALTRTFVALELVFSLIFVGLCLALTPRYGLEGAAMAYAATYGAYWLVVRQVFGALTERLRISAVAAELPGAKP
jgi:PST family polysaccharide transporter